MLGEYRPYEERTPDEQYKNLIRTVLKEGRKGPSPMVDAEGKEVSTIDLMGAPVMRFRILENGVPFLTERSLRSFWPAASGGGGTVCVCERGADAGGAGRVWL